MSKIALLSVYEKAGLTYFARRLVRFGFSLIASGGTALHLKEHGVDVTDVAKITKRAAVLGHRVVTLAPEIHGGLMATLEMRDELNKLGWPWIDLVCVDLYPLWSEVADPNATDASVIEKTDIGGPTLIRSAAKGRRFVIARTKERERVLQWLEKNGTEFDDKSAAFRRHLAGVAEGVVARYCLTSAKFHAPPGVYGDVAVEPKWPDD